MGLSLVGRLIGGPQAVATLGSAAREVAEVFTPSATRRMELSAEAQRAALDQHGAEFAVPRAGWFDALVNAMNRLPRPMLALGTLGLFVHAMADPEGFARRMQGLAHVPEPLWWLLGAIVAFYFGARETHYFRVRHPAEPAPQGVTGAGATPPPDPTVDTVPGARAANPALDDWSGPDPGRA